MSESRYVLCSREERRLQMNPYTDTITMPLCAFRLIVQQKRILENADRHVIELKEIVDKEPAFSVYKNGKLIKKGDNDGSK